MLYVEQWLELLQGLERRDCLRNLRLRGKNVPKYKDTKMVARKIYKQVSCAYVTDDEIFCLDVGAETLQDFWIFMYPRFLNSTKTKMTEEEVEIMLAYLICAQLWHNQFMFSLKATKGWFPYW
jgi:hypothetical protein